MRIITTILLLICYQANATIYYVDDLALNDLGSGTTTGTAWKTIAKINASTFAAGDFILFKRGGVWNERLNPPSSGSVGNPITFGAYGTGARPIITGLQSLTGFVNTGGNIWTATATNAVSALNTVLIGGVIRAKGRYPNYGNINPTSGTTTRIIAPLTGVPNFTGGEVATRSQRWVINVTKIASQSGDTVNLSPALSDNANVFFFQNHVNALDTAGEWAYVSATKVLSVYSSTMPTGVRYSSIDTVVHIYSKDNITVDGINFEGGNLATIEMRYANNITVQNCNVDNSGYFGIYGESMSNLKIQGDTVRNSFSDGIHVDPIATLLVNNNWIKNSGHFAGMGGSGNLRYHGIYETMTNGIITNNTVDSSGYIGLRWGGINSLVKHNYVSNFGYVKDDGAGIYTFVGNGSPYLDTGSIVRGNIVRNGIGAPLLNGNDRYASGIYLDDGTQGVTVDSNTILNTTFASIFLHKTVDIIVRGNTVLDNTAMTFYMEGFIANVKGNTFYSQNPHYTTNLYTILNYLNDMSQLVSDSNYFLRPSNENNIINAFKIPYDPTTYSLPGWQAFSGKDANSRGMPTGVTSINGVIHYNETLVSKTIPLSGNYRDARGRTYNGYITLLPFTSAILFPVAGTIFRSIGNLNFEQ